MQTLPLVLGLFAIMTALVAVARRIGVPYPIFLVLAGLIIAFIPGLPAVSLDPQLVFLLFLPPILTSAGFFTPLRDFKSNLRPILMLSLGLVVFTTLVVGWSLHLAVPSLPLAVCFTLGAIVAPPDAIATTSLAERLGLPHRIITILEGESLLNDASALICYRFAVAAAVSGSFSLGSALQSFAIASVGGIVIGLGLSHLLLFVFRYIDDTNIRVILTFVNTLAAYSLAEHYHLSGVLAAVALGLHFGRHGSIALGPAGRVHGAAAWQAVVFAINGAAFLLIGLQLPTALNVDGVSRSTVAIACLVASVATIVARIVWVFPAAYLPRYLSQRIREKDPYPSPQNIFVVSWAGMRGIVSLAAALALPLDFPYRNFLVLLTFVVVLATLVGQGVSLMVLIPRLNLINESIGNEESKARIHAIQAGLKRLAELENEHWVVSDHVSHFRRVYEKQHVRHAHRLNGQAHEVEELIAAAERLREELMQAETAAIIDLRNQNVINDATAWNLIRELDLERLQRADAPA